jgi:hypothetical protein
MANCQCVTFATRSDKCVIIIPRQLAKNTYYDRCIWKKPRLEKYERSGC